jgi:hypothetical protein
MRNDGSLYSGITSSSFGVVKEKRQTVQEQKLEKRTRLNPVVEILKAEFAKEYETLSRIDYLKVEEMLTDNDLRAELMARKKTLERLKAIETRINNILREPSAKRTERTTED